MKSKRTDKDSKLREQTEELVKDYPNNFSDFGDALKI